MNNYNVTVRVRGGEEVKATVSSARLKVLAHGKKRMVVALKYEDESDYRYLVATDTEIVNVVVASMVKIYATFLAWVSISLALPSFALSGLR